MVVSDRNFGAEGATRPSKSLNRSIYFKMDRSHVITNNSISHLIGEGAGAKLSDPHRHLLAIVNQ